METVTILTLIFGAGAFATGLYSIFYAHRRDKINIVLTDAEVDLDDIDEQVIYRFSIHNISSRAVIISDVKALRDNIEIKDTGHEPSPEKVPLLGHSNPLFHTPELYNTRPRYLSGFYSDNFEGPKVLEPNDSVALSYYYEVAPNQIIVKISEPKNKTFKFNKDFMGL